MKRDIRIGLTDNNFIHFGTAEIVYIPDLNHPKYVDVKCAMLEVIRIPYHSISFIQCDWSKENKS